MKQIAKVEIISANHLDIFKWLRKEMKIRIYEAKEISNQKIIDFGCDYEKAILLFTYLHGCMANSARLIIDVTYDNTRCVGSYGYTEDQIKDDLKYSDEYNN